MADVSNAVVTLDNAVTGVGAIGGTTPTSISQLEQLIGQPALEGDDAPVHGWRFSLARTASLPSERNVTQTSVLGDVLFASGFSPSSDLCGGEGGSELYGVYYKTGTPRGDLPIFGSVGAGQRRVTWRFGLSGSARVWRLHRLCMLVRLEMVAASRC